MLGGGGWAVDVLLCWLRNSLVTGFSIIAKLFNWQNQTRIISPVF